MDSITINFPINDLREVLEFVAKQCNDNHYSARDFKSDYDSAISCKDDDDYDADDAECCFRRYTECLESAKSYEKELERLLEYTEKNHHWIINNLNGDSEFQAHISWLNPGIKRYEHLEFDESGVASFYLDARGMIIKKTHSKYGRDYHQVKFVKENGESYYIGRVINIDDHRNIRVVRDVYHDVYSSQIEEFMINLQTCKRRFNDDDDDDED